jgi:hypothetical protein
MAGKKETIRIKSCNDFMKRGFAAQFGETLKFLSPLQAAGNSNLNSYFAEKPFQDSYLDAYSYF